jgi:transmembrane sensor
LPRLETVVPITRAKRATPWRTVGIAAAVCALALPLAAYSGWNLGLLPNSYQHFEASNAIRQVTLSDGSQVELNLGTELTFSNYKDQRRVSLDKGEAFFSVSHDASHPFVVKAADGRIRVTGTKFNVWMYEDQVRVNLIEGSVLVSSNDDLPGDGLRLEPSMQARYKHGDFTPQISQTYANDTSLAWRHGKLVLDDLALSEALPLINRYLENPVMVADNSTGAIRLGGIYNIKELHNLVATLPRVLPVYLTRNKEGNPVLNSIPQQPPKS